MDLKQHYINPRDEIRFLEKTAGADLLILLYVALFLEITVYLVCRKHCLCAC